MITKSNSEDVIPPDLYYNFSEDSCNTLPEPFINSEAERLFTPNAPSIIFVIYFSMTFIVEYLSISNLLSKSVIKYDRLCMSLREPTKEVGKLKPDFILYAISETSFN